MEEGKIHADHWLVWCAFACLTYKISATGFMGIGEISKTGRPTDRSVDPTSGSRVRGEGDRNGIPKMKTLLNNVYWPQTQFSWSNVQRGRHVLRPKPIEQRCTHTHTATQPHRHTRNVPFPFYNGVYVRLCCLFVFDSGMFVLKFHLSFGTTFSCVDGALLLGSVAE